jgi:hypothetical protein
MLAWCIGKRLKDWVCLKFCQSPGYISADGSIFGRNIELCGHSGSSAGSRSFSCVVSGSKMVDGNVFSGHGPGSKLANAASACQYAVLDEACPRKSRTSPDFPLTQLLLTTFDSAYLSGATIPWVVWAVYQLLLEDGDEGDNEEPADRPVETNSLALPRVRETCRWLAKECLAPVHGYLATHLARSVQEMTPRQRELKGLVEVV